MIQKFHRNRNKPANEDIAELIFHVAEDKIHISYHTEDVRIAASAREFLKPPNWDEKGAVLTFNPEMHQTFQVGRELDVTIRHVSVKLCYVLQWIALLIVTERTVFSFNFQ